MTRAMVDMLAFGLPVCYVEATRPTEGCENHGSATRHGEDIKHFLSKEVQLGAMIGPFKSYPFSDRDKHNQMMARPKKDSSHRRVILDQSYPQGSNVNSGVPSGILDGAEFKMNLPNPKWFVGLGVGYW